MNGGFVILAALMAISAAHDFARGNYALGTVALLLTTGCAVAACLPEEKKP